MGEVSKKDPLAMLINANNLESNGDYRGAIELCSSALGDGELPDHFLTLARNYYNLACNGDERYGWRALFAALEGIDQKCKSSGMKDVEYAIGIIRWVLDHFSDWHRFDVTASHTRAKLADEDCGLPESATMMSMLEGYLSMSGADEPMIIANRLYQESPLIIRPGRLSDGVERECRFALATQFSQVPGIDIRDQARFDDYPVPAAYNFQTYDKYLLTSANQEIIRLRARGRNIPSIIVTCLPKSASEFLCYTLADVLGAAIVRVTIGDPFRGLILDEWVSEITRGGAVLHDHFSARFENIKTLRQCNVGNIYVLIRDPRAVAFSLRNMGEELGVAQDHADQMPGLNKPFRSFPLTVGMLAQWIDGWAALQSPGFTVQFIKFSDLVANPSSVMGSILEECGASQYLPALSSVLANRGKGSNFRKGDDNAWRSSVPCEVAADAWLRIPSSVRALLNLVP